MERVREAYVNECQARNKELGYNQVQSLKNAGPLSSVNIEQRNKETQVST
jgi:hypothetical protein